MDIVVASDENYAVHMATLLCSICEHNRNSKIDIHILDGGIELVTNEKIYNMKKVYNNLDIHTYKIDDQFIKERFKCSIANDRSLMAFSRVFIPNVLPINIKRALYLDVDAVVLNSLEDLFNLDMHNFAMAGVVDVNPLNRRRSVGLNKNDLYINSGMILWNLELCRNIDIVNQFIEFVRDRDGNVDAMDQGTINGTMKGHILKLEPKYNVMTPFFQLKANNLAIMGEWNSYYTKAEIDCAINNPVYVHYTPNMTTRPWQKNCKHPLKNKYWEYRMKTSFNNNKLEKDLRSKKMQFISFLYYTLPYKFFRKIIGVLK